MWQQHCEDVLHELGNPSIAQETVGTHEELSLNYTSSVNRFPTVPCDKSVTRHFVFSFGKGLQGEFCILYSSDSQPGVRVPLGVRKHTAGGTWKHLIITCVTLYFLRIINMGVLMV